MPEEAIMKLNNETRQIANKMNRYIEVFADSQLNISIGIERGRLYLDRQQPATLALEPTYTQVSFSRDCVQLDLRHLKFKSDMRCSK